MLSQNVNMIFERFARDPHMMSTWDTELRKARHNTGWGEEWHIFTDRKPPHPWQMFSVTLLRWVVAAGGCVDHISLFQKIECGLVLRRIHLLIVWCLNNVCGYLWDCLTYLGPCLRCTFFLVCCSYCYVCTSTTSKSWMSYPSSISISISGISRSSRK